MDQRSSLNYLAKPSLNAAEVKAVKVLEARCVAHDHTVLKLELDYKFSAAEAGSVDPAHQNEFLCYDGECLVGYIGISSFGGSEPEVAGMVDPDYRRNGIFTKLLGQVKAELTRRRIPSMLLLNDPLSNAGKPFIQTLDVDLEHTEYEMFLKLPWKIERPEAIKKGIQLRKATNQDADEVARQNDIYFNNEATGSEETTLQVGTGTDRKPATEAVQERRLLPEEEEKRGMTIYLATLADGGTIGKIHLEYRQGKGGIYGLGVLPAHRSKGYGRALLLTGTEILLEKGATAVYLQVNAVNENALKLYRSCGFEVTSAMDYYRLWLRV
ncbi:GNAT family N-acetyltransferase [Acidaminobacter hydrogenoformans]|uniref:Acetyltransferase (GNAT) family protein n=1 Tax=Acidaminobacter hydrogenoformans DSM 2784 TaxID=1120920 RepID=A0A1G5S807_9FIRM|nr:GNAT family N-acetyltransferase [Acidaminobacter hydrogenoformans]SCZ81851.1 Acetyltransferase (GNAT) family protein [Acidaminobacter hydrogenoformans DSM 2784]